MNNQHWQHQLILPDSSWNYLYIFLNLEQFIFKEVDGHNVMAPWRVSFRTFDVVINIYFDMEVVLTIIACYKYHVWFSVQTWRICCSLPLCIPYMTHSSLCTQAGKKRAEKRHKFMENFVAEFYEEWSGRAWSWPTRPWAGRARLEVGQPTLTNSHR